MKQKAKQPGIITIQGGKQYQKVPFRVHNFRKDHPAESGWDIQTEIITEYPRDYANKTPGYIIFRCQILNPDGNVVATGHGYNTTADGNKYLEKAETVSIGRALAFFNPMFSGESMEIASYEEMEKAGFKEELQGVNNIIDNPVTDVMSSMKEHLKEQPANGVKTIDSYTKPEIVDFINTMKDGIDKDAYTEFRVSCIGPHSLNTLNKDDLVKYYRDLKAFRAG